MKQSFWWISELIASTSKVPLASSLETQCLLERIAPGVFIAVKLLYFQNATLIGLFYSLFDSLNYCRRQSELYCCIHDKLCPETDPGYRCWPIHCRQPWVKAWLVSNSKTFIIKTKLSQYHCCFLWQFDNFFVNSMPWSMTLHRAGKAEKKYYDFM